MLSGPESSPCSAGRPSPWLPCRRFATLHSTDPRDGLRGCWSRAKQPSGAWKGILLCYFLKWPFFVAYLGEQIGISLVSQVKLLNPPGSDCTSPLCLSHCFQLSEHTAFQPYPACTCSEIILSAFVNLNLCSWGPLVWNGLAFIFSDSFSSFTSPLNAPSYRKASWFSPPRNNDSFLCAPTILSVSPFSNDNITSRIVASLCLSSHRLWALKGEGLCRFITVPSRPGIRPGIE